MMTMLREKPAIIVAQAQKHRPVFRRRCRAALALLTLLGLAGRTVLSDTQAVQAVVQMLHHLHLFGL